MPALPSFQTISKTLISNFCSDSFLPFLKFNDELPNNFLFVNFYLTFIVCYHISVKLSAQGPSHHLKIANIIPNRVTVGRRITILIKKHSINQLLFHTFISEGQGCIPKILPHDIFWYDMSCHFEMYTVLYHEKN